VEVECAWPIAALLGEGPMWSVADQSLWFVDIKGQKLHALHEASGARRTIATPEYAAFVFRDVRGGLLCGLRSGLFRCDPEREKFELIMKVDAEHPANRLNDGHVDRLGRLWFGTMDDREQGATGSLYRYADGRLERLDGGYVIPNGPALSPDGTILYHVDTLQRCIHAFDVDTCGALSGKRLFVTLDGDGAHPDGTAVDSVGNLWVALFGGWGVRCYSPGAELLHTVELPVAQCTKAAFGGPDLRTLYVTTASVGLTDEERRRQPLAGALFRTRVAIPGMPSNAFAG